MKRFVIGWCCAFLMLTAAGCAAVVAGAGAGVYTYMSGELKRTYPVGLDTAVRASEEALQLLKISVTEKQSEAARRTFLGLRTDEVPVTVTLTVIGTHITEIGVRSGIVGYWDRSGSELVHASIAKRLQ